MLKETLRLGAGKPFFLPPPPNLERHPRAETSFQALYLFPLLHGEEGRGKTFGYKPSSSFFLLRGGIVQRSLPFFSNYCFFFFFLRDVQRAW